MSYLKKEQICAIAMRALEDVGMPAGDNLFLAIMSPSFTVAMYLDEFCELVKKTQDFSPNNQIDKANYVIRDTIKHRWKKHLKPLKVYCKDSFINYCIENLQESKHVIKTLSHCLLVMVAFENTLAYESLDIDDPVTDIRDKFVNAMQEGSSIRDLFAMIPKDLRGDELIDLTFGYYKQMCIYSDKSFADKIFSIKKRTIMAMQKQLKAREGGIPDSTYKILFAVSGVCLIFLMIYFAFLYADMQAQITEQRERYEYQFKNWCRTSFSHGSVTDIT